MGQSFFEPNGLMMAFSWSILMSLNVVFSNVLGNYTQRVERCRQKSFVLSCPRYGGIDFLIDNPESI